MRALITVLQMALRLCWLAAIVLGLLFWTGTAVGLVEVHMLLGVVIAVLVLALAVIAGLRGKPGLLAAGVVVAILLPVVGMGQTGWLVGPAHWVIQVLHLLVGLAAIAVGEAAGRRARQAA